MNITQTIPAALQNALDEFNLNFPRPGIKPLAFSAPYDLRNDWPKTYPHARHQGVYCFVDGIGTLLYIGKTSCNTDFGYRLAAHFEYGPARQAQAKLSHHASVQHILFIPLPPGHGFEAPAIEEWLITRINPPLNKTGTQRTRKVGL